MKKKIIISAIIIIALAFVSSMQAQPFADETMDNKSSSDFDEMPNYLDYGDAPDDADSPRYPTLLENNGARHAVCLRKYNKLSIGNYTDTENNGNPYIDALGDDFHSSVSRSFVDDEDGVSFIGDFIQGANVTAQVKIIGQGVLYIWADFNRNDSWSDSGEEVVSGAFVATGTYYFTISVPSASTPGISYIRSRLFEGIYSEEAKLPYGYGGCGEVEDYRIEIKQKEYDYGDAPDDVNIPQYPTLIENNGAHHIPDDQLYLGLVIPDAEPNGIPNNIATGDDTDNSDDEDGVTFALIQNSLGSITVTVTNTTFSYALFNAWIDLEMDYSWSQSADHVVIDHLIPPYTSNFTFTVNTPILPYEGTTYARCRLSLQSDLSFTGFGDIGEVEDYQVVIRPDTTSGEFDFGDAPEDDFYHYYTVLPDGARHTVSNSLFLGIKDDGPPDTEPNGSIPPYDASGDDISGSKPDDEEAVTFSPLIPGTQANIKVNTFNGTSEPAYVNGWIDFDRNGYWDPNEHIIIDESVLSGSNIISKYVSVPGYNNPGWTFARFRISREKDLSYKGNGGVGEVEDYRVFIEKESYEEKLDFGDAPYKPDLLNFPTMLAQDGARHVICDYLYLGKEGDSPDIDADGQADFNALGDDTWDGYDDEQAVRFLGGWRQGEDVKIEVIVFGEGHLNAWIDYDGSGDWTDPQEHVLTDEFVSTGIHVFPTTVPTDANVGERFSRFRLTSYPGISFDGVAEDGEVEDHQVDIHASDK
ncbi:MAG: hypothetical protein GY795_13515 [Desulfobacterales bacterium]|nr:hypothetical protein [Desulfobacterales bacterium]